MLTTTDINYRRHSLLIRFRIQGDRTDPDSLSVTVYPSTLQQKTIKRKAKLHTATLSLSTTKVVIAMIRADKRHTSMSLIANYSTFFLSVNGVRSTLKYGLGYLRFKELSHFLAYGLYIFFRICIEIWTDF